MQKTKTIQLMLKVPEDWDPDALVVHFKPEPNRTYHLEVSGKGRVYAVDGKVVDHAPTTTYFAA
ncbi:MAG: hypothetical protein ACRC48_06750 [Aeromonas veronii]